MIMARKTYSVEAIIEHDEIAAQDMPGFDGFYSYQALGPRYCLPFVHVGCASFIEPHLVFG